ncbi:hypothetical protein JTB14_036645 [Gonioctena quinquepunctata]|nr:hypothetical protein JTB14_036645 [Gonioctena quinquepunctata]
MVPLVPVYVAGLFGLVVAVPIEHYATKYDHIDVEMILNNRRMVNHYAACLLNKGPCPPEGLEFKRILPEALQTNCLKCTEKQKTVTMRAIKRLKKEYPKIWSQLQNEWDPDGSLTAKFEATYGNRQNEPIPLISVNILNRFGSEDDAESNNPSTSSTSSVPPTTTKNSIVSTKNPGPPPTTTKSFIVSTTKSDNKSVKSGSTTKKVIASTTESVKLVNRIITNTPIVTNTITNNYKPPPYQFRPLANIGASIEATVRMVKSVEKNIFEIAKRKLIMWNNLLTG